MASKYAKPSPNLTVLLVAITALLTVATAAISLPAGWVLFAGFLVVAWAHPAPMLTGPKETPANEREERLVLRHRSWLDTRSSLLMGNSWGWETLWCGIPPRLSYIVTATIGALVATLPLSGDLPTQLLQLVGGLIDRTAPPVPMPWWVSTTSGFLTHHTMTSMLARSRRIQERPAVTLSMSVLRGLWSSTARPFILLAPVTAVLGAWAAKFVTGWLGQEEQPWLIVAPIAGAVLAVAATLGRPLSEACLGRWQTLRTAQAEWAPRFSEAFSEKEGAPRLVDRTIAPCGAIVDVMDAPPKLMVAGLRDRAELLSAAYGDPSTRIDVIASPNLDASGSPIRGTAHQLRARVVQWPEGSFPNLLDPDLDELSRDLALETAMSRALDAVGVNRMVLVEAAQAADLPAKVDPRLADHTQKREQRVHAQIEELGEDDEEKIAQLEASLDEPFPAPRTSPLRAAWRWLRGAEPLALVTPEDSPLAAAHTCLLEGVPTIVLAGLRHVGPSSTPRGPGGCPAWSAH